MKIYDCFTFYNELDLLELRLAELYDHVDHFVLVEANQTFTNRPKPYIFLENRERFDKYLDKIIHVMINDMPGGDNPWLNEKHQRDSIMHGLKSSSPEDIIIVTDVDEIPRPEAIEHISKSSEVLFALRMPLFNFKFNYMRATPGEYDVWGMACKRSALETITTDHLRQLRFGFFDKPWEMKQYGCEVVEHAGWHFGYLGDKEYLLDKAQSFSHTEVNTPEFLAQLDPEASIAERKEWNRKESAKYKIVEIGPYFPRKILENLDKYSKYILDDFEDQVYNILPFGPR